MSKVEIAKLIIARIRELIYSPECKANHCLPKHFVRNRVLSFIHVVMYLLFTSKQKMEINISVLIENLGSDVFPHVCKQAVSKARQAILPSLFLEAFNLSVDHFYNNIRNRKSWNNLHVFAIDGTKLVLPKSKSNFSHFGEMFSKKNPSRRWSMALGSIVYDVLEDYVVHASIDRYLASERHAALNHLKVLEDLGLYNNSIVIFDRGYYSEAMFRYCVSHGHLCLMRLKDSIGIAKECKRSAKSDYIAVLKGNPKNGTEDLRVRVIEVPLSSGELEYLATNLFDKKYTAQMFYELYFKRWPIEVKYMELKQKLNIETFSGATAISVQQEFYINLLISNLAALVKADADEVIDQKCSSTNKYRYQADRSFVLSRMKSLLPKIIFGIRDVSYIDIIFRESCRTRSQVQPNRHNARNIKPSSTERKHFNNRKPAI